MRSNSTINATAQYTKTLGETPLEAVMRFRQEYPAYATEKIAYAGRLDPMAQGELLLLVGEACKERDKYLTLDKEYEFEILLGCSSDTQDILGITHMGETSREPISTERIQGVVEEMEGEHNMPYPAFSSQTVLGKPLFLWALEDRLDEITIPSKEIEVYRLVYQGCETISADQLLTKVEQNISRVSHVDDASKALGRDFRRQEVLAQWRTNMQGRNGEQYQILKLRCACSSGTYMRTLAQAIAQQLGTEGLAWSIARTRIGQWDGTQVVPINTTH